MPKIFIESNADDSSSVGQNNVHLSRVETTKYTAAEV